MNDTWNQKLSCPLKSNHDSILSRVVEFWANKKKGHNNCIPKNQIKGLSHSLLFPPSVFVTYPIFVEPTVSDFLSELVYTYTSKSTKPNKFLLHWERYTENITNMCHPLLSSNGLAAQSRRRYAFEPSILVVRPAVNPQRTVATGAAGGSGGRRMCLCSPTSHPGSFRCRYHQADYVWWRVKSRILLNSSQ